MSAYVVTPRAEADLSRIYAYSVETWGEARARVYIDALFSRFAWLTTYPTLGKPREDIAPGYRSFPQGSHLVFYMVNGHDIFIIGVPHMSMDVGAYFDGPS